MPISSRFVVGSTISLLAIGFLTLFAIVGASVWLSDRAQVYFNEAAFARETRIAAVELRDALRTAESSQRGYLLTGNEIYLAPYSTARSTVLRQLDTLRQKLAGQDRIPMLLRLTAVLGEKVEDMNRTIARKGEGRDAEALEIVRTNRGKALTDEANVFLYGIILDADERIAAGVVEQQRNTSMLRLASVIGALVIVFVVGVVTFTILKYAQEIAQARDEVRNINAGLEERVTLRTADLAAARERAEVLLAEVNHRVANSLQLVAALVNMQTKAVDDAAAKAALAETQSRIYAISLIHRSLYSSTDVQLVTLDEYLSDLLDHLETSMRAVGHGASLRYDIAPLKMPTDAGVSLGVVVTEWVTNAFKYAYPDHSGEVRVQLRHADDGRAELTVEDDGIGRRDAAAAKGTGLGTRIVTAMASGMGAEIHYEDRRPGLRARLRFTPATA